MQVLLTGMSTMLENVIAAALSPAADVEIARTDEEGEYLLKEVLDRRIDAVVTATQQPQDTEAIRQLLFGAPSLIVVAIAGDGSSGFVHRLQIHSSRLAPLSSSTLLAALRDDPPLRAH